MTKLAELNKVFIDISKALSDKGIKGKAKPTEFAEKIEQLDVSDEQPYQWKVPEGWPDIKKICQEDTQGSDNRLILLTNAEYSLTTQFSIVNSISAYSTSEGDYITSNTLKTWDKAKDIVSPTGERFRWIILYLNNPVLTITGSQIPEAKNVLWIYMNDRVKYSPNNMYSFDTYGCLRRLEGYVSPIGNGGGGLFIGAANLESIEGTLDFSSATTAYRLFDGCCALRKIPDVLDISNCTNVAAMFRYCYNLKNVPNVLDFSKVTSGSDSIFSTCKKLRKSPEMINLQNLSGSVAYMFSGCVSLKDGPKYLNVQNATDCQQLFNGCTNLRDAPSTMIMPNKPVGYNSMFQDCMTISSIPEDFTLSNANNLWALFSGCTNLQNVMSCVYLDNLLSTSYVYSGSVFQSCHSIKKFPDVWYFPGSGQYSPAFGDCNRLPKVFSAPNISVTGFSVGYQAWENPLSIIVPNVKSWSSDATAGYNSPKYIDTNVSFILNSKFFRESYKHYFANFDSNGNITGDCLINNLKDVTAIGPLTITLQYGSTLKSQFTAMEQTAIATMVTSKGWTLSW